MARNKELKLIQLQLPPELADEIDQMAEVDRRSRTNQVIYLIEQGIIRRKRMLDLIAQETNKSTIDDN